MRQEWLEKNREEVKQVAVAAYNRIPDKLELEWLAMARLKGLFRALVTWWGLGS